MKLAYAALAKAQTEMGKALKTAANPHLKSKYADLGSVMDACFDALHSNGFAIFQPSGHDEHGPYVETVFAHESGDCLTSRVYLVLGKQDMQAVGSAQTYARRYGLLGLAGLAPEDDDGEATKRPVRQETARPANIIAVDSAIDLIARADDLAKLAQVWKTLGPDVQAEPRVFEIKESRKAVLSRSATAQAAHDAQRPAA